MLENGPSPEGFSEHVKERSRQMVLGAAIGDTLGMPVEGWTPAQIAKYVGKITQPMSSEEVQALARNNPNFDPSDAPLKFMDRTIPRGEWTDDTHLLLAVTRGIVRARGLDLDAVAKAHIELAELIEESDDPNVWGVFGKTTQTAIERLADGVKPENSGVWDKNATGNGPALKTAPIGVYAYRYGDYEEGLNFAKKVSEMTHRNPASVAAGVVQAHAIYSLLDGVPRELFLEECLDTAREFEDDLGDEYTYLMPKLEFIIDNEHLTPPQMQKAVGNRFRVTESYPFALYMLHHYWDRPIEGMIEAVSMGGDSDSVGAIYGALMGAKGVEMPHEWQIVLKDRNNLTAIAHALATTYPIV